MIDNNIKSAEEFIWDIFRTPENLRQDIDGLKIKGSDAAQLMRMYVEYLKNEKQDNSNPEDMGKIY